MLLKSGPDMHSDYNRSRRNYKRCTSTVTFRACARVINLSVERPLTDFNLVPK